MQLCLSGPWQAFVCQMNFEHAYGAVLGAFVGDAAGAVLEFAPKPDQKAVTAAALFNV